jgi:hypothetical protein
LFGIVQADQVDGKQPPTSTRSALVGAAARHRTSGWAAEGGSNVSAGNLGRVRDHRRQGAPVSLKKLQGAGGVQIIDTASVAVGWPKQVSIPCASSAPEDAIEAVSTGGTSLRYDSTGQQFIFNWQTPKQVNSCWRLDVHPTHTPQPPRTSHGGSLQR